MIHTQKLHSEFCCCCGPPYALYIIVHRKAEYLFGGAKTRCTELETALRCRHHTTTPVGWCVVWPHDGIVPFSIFS